MAEIILQSEPAIQDKCAFNFEFNYKDNNELEVNKDCVKQKEIDINPDEVSCRPPPLITLDSLSKSHIECDCCGDDDVSENLIKLFKHRRTHNSSNSTKFSKINNFRKLCFNCPLHFDSIIFLDGCLNLQKGRSGLHPSCDFCQKHFFY